MSSRTYMTGQKSKPAAFVKKLEKLWDQDKFVCVGLDSDYSKLPVSVKGKPSERIFKFNKEIIDSTYDLVCSYKPNIAFYEAMGVDGLNALTKTVRYIKQKYPQIPIILDAKRSDIGNTNNGYVKAYFDEMDVDAITIHPYLGREAVQPFLERSDKGVIVLVKTSNSGAGEFQDLKINKEPLYLTVAKKVAKDWNENGNIGLVVGATYPSELAIIRDAVGDIPFLIPGIGAQKGNVEKTIQAGKDSKNRGMIINSSRDILFASSGRDFAATARKKTQELHDAINQARAI